MLLLGAISVLLIRFPALCHNFYPTHYRDLCSFCGEHPSLHYSTWEGPNCPANLEYPTHPPPVDSRSFQHNPGWPVKIDWPVRPGGALDQELHPPSGTTWAKTTSSTTTMLTLLSSATLHNSMQKALSLFYRHWRSGCIQTNETDSHNVCMSVVRRKLLRTSRKWGEQIKNCRQLLWHDGNNIWLGLDR